MQKRRYFTLFIIFSIGLIGLATTFLPKQSAAGQSLSPKAAVEQAWRLAQESGSYDFDIVIEQTTYPLSRLSNAGAAPIEDTVASQGQVDLFNETMQLTLWQDGSFNPDTGVTLRVEDGHTYGRNGQAEWEEIDNVADLFAPGGDPMAFLSGIKNITGGQNSQINIGEGDAELSLQLSQYAFEMDGPVFADYMRQQLETRLRDEGSLPAGLNLSTPEIYRTMTGVGEMWIDADGLPARMMVDLDFPASEDSGRMTAVMTSDFSSYDLERLGLAETAFTQNPLLWVANRLPDPETSRQASLNLSVLLAFVGLLGLSVPHWRSRRFYAAVASAVICSMLISPLLRGHHYQVFQDEMTAKQEAQQAQKAEYEQQSQAVSAVQESSWNPNLPPVEQFTSAEKDSFAHNKPAVQSSTPITTTDSDGDGLSDADEDIWYTCAYAAAPENCDGVVDPTDSDGDGLTDGIEVHQLGTIPAREDSDGDTISDLLEVTGFDYNGTTWYLNPMDRDSNHDDRPDGLECLVWSSISSDYDPTAICPDSDGNGTPDLFDYDNDGDGVDDNIDLAPDNQAGVFNNDNPFTYEIDNLTLDKPVLVDFQITPTDSEHLTYYNRVLDWPANDYDGQIERGLDTTFASTSNPDIKSSDDNASYGDIRLIPMLEITMPGSPGHFANLPVNAAYSGSSRVSGVPVEAWLDTTELDPYGIVVRDLDDSSGDLAAYLPLTTVSDKEGASVQAYAARMLYYPEQGNAGFASWGADHEVRFVWLVQMITDTCQTPDDDPETCSRVETLEVIHVYEEQWQLAGMQVSEEHGLDVAVMYEDPTADTDLTVDEQLWAVAWNLNNTFMRGRDCDSFNGGVCQSDGMRDVTVGNMATKINEWSSNSSYVEVETFSYLHEGYAAHIAMTETVQLLNDHFTSYADQTDPTFLFANERRLRTLNLADAIVGGDLYSFDLDPSSVTEQVVASVNWSPYCYQGGQWQNCDMGTYLTDLETRLRNAEAFPSLVPADELDPELEGWLIWTQLFYTAVANGLTNWVEAYENPLWVPDDVDEARFDAAWYTTDFLVHVSERYHDQLKAAYSGTYKAYKTAGKWQKFYYAFDDENGTMTLDLEIELGIAHSVTNMIVGATIVITLVGIGLVLAGLITGNSVYVKVGLIVLQAAALAVLLTRAMILVWQISIAVRAGITSISGLNNIAAISGSATIVYSFIMTVSVIWGLFIYQVMYGNARFGSLEFNLALAKSIAETVVAAIFLALALIPVVGPLIVILLSITDIILYLVGHKGLSQWLGEKLAAGMYDVNYLISNLDDPERLQFGIEAVQLQDEAGGFVASNAITYTLIITNDIKFKKGSDDDDGRRATFRYFLQTTETDQHNGLAQNDMKDEWVSLPGRFLETTAIATSPMIPLADTDTGINSTLNGLLYLTEAAVSPYKGCWTIPSTGVGSSRTQCDWYDYADSSHINIGQYITYDILPPTIEAFANMDWNHNPNLPFPRQTDKDGDGLMSIALGGTDPDDSRYDKDGDGLSDYYEQIHGTKPANQDTDGDGLTDKEELFYGTDPVKPDTDFDNLNDFVEVKEGWLVVYDEDGSGNPLLTRVWSNPFSPNSDNDSLGDFEEFVYSTNPNSATDESIIENLIQFSNLQVQEKDTPELLLQFEDGLTASNFVDSSGNNRTASCTVCPTVVSGRYGQALAFDGIDDYIIAPYSPDPAETNFTAAAWININDLSSDGRILHQDGGPAFLNVFSNGRLSTYLGGANLVSTQILSLNQWYHVAVSYDGTTVKLYINGSLTASDDRTISANSGSLYIGSHWNLAQSRFGGLIDEVALFDYALSDSEMLALMSGRYNVNDQYLRPGAELTYEATISNTLVTQGANGFMVAGSEQISPTIPPADLALHFDEQERIQSFLPTTGNSSTWTCIDNGTCPTDRGGGPLDRAREFDGVDDIIYIPTMNVREEQGLQDWFDNFTIGFWLKVDTLPAPGERMYVIDTEDERPGALDVYIDSEGWIWFDVQDTILVAQGTLCALCTDGDVWDYNESQVGQHTAQGMDTFTADDGRYLGVWVHYVFLYQQGKNNAAKNWTYLYANDEAEYVDTQLYYMVHKYQGPEYDGLRLGPGTVGGRSDGSGSFLDGWIDEVNIYNGESLFDGTDNAIEAMYNHDVDYLIPPSFRLKFLRTQVSRSYVDDVLNTARADCGKIHSDFEECPTQYPDGQFGEAVSFDGSDDYLWVGPMDFPRGDYTIGGWFKTSFSSASQTLLGGMASVDDLDPPLRISITDQGKVEFLHKFPVTDQGVTVSSPGGFNDGTWHYFTAVRQGTTSLLYMDGLLVDSDTGSSPADSTPLIRLGRWSDPHVSRYDGQLDEFTIIPAALDAEGVQTMMNSIWPAIEIDNDFVDYHLDPVSSVIVSGTARVDDTTHSGLHRFDQEVEAAIELPQPIDIPVVDNNADNIGIYAPFEDLPSATTFENIVGDSEYTCIIVSACPTAGLRGSIDRAALFDGVDDYLLINDSGAMLSWSVWVKADRGVIFDTRTNYPKRGIELDFGQLRVLSGNNDGLAANEVTLPLDLPENEWTHLVVTINKGANLVRLYVNGIEVGSQTYAGTDPDTTNPTLGGNPKGGNYLNGYLDDFRAYDIILTPADVLSLYQNSAAALRFEFDETSDAISFADASPNGFTGVPSTRIFFNETLGQDVVKINPLPGTDGKIGNTGMFIGQGIGSLVVDPDDDSALDLNDLTFMAWVKPTGPSDPVVGEVLLMKVGNTSGPGLDYNYQVRFIPGTSRLRFVAELSDCSTFIDSFDSVAGLTANQWSHVALTFDGNIANFYINGQLDSSKSYPDVDLCQSDDSIKIGTNFPGEMDELALYGRAMSIQEIFSIYQRELRWYRANAVSYLTVDDDNPTIELLSDYPYRSDGYIQLAVATQDPTSWVTLLEMGLKAPGDSAFTWSSVEACQDSGVSGVAWCPYFDSSASAGPGTYEIEFRAVDVVGNETTSTVYQLYVDDTPPVASSTYGTNNWMQADEVSGEELAWTISLNGSIDDSEIATGLAGSGLVTETVMVALVDKTGYIHSGPQQAAISGTTWNIDYTFHGERPVGPYTIEVTAEDVVGNQSTTNVGAIFIDERPPTARLNSQLLPGIVISQNLTLNGLVSEQPNWSGEIAHYSFEEAVGAAEFNDASGEGNHGTCANCPTAGLSGVFGSALQFDGVNDTVNLTSMLDPITDTFSLSAWFLDNGVNSAVAQVLIYQANGTGQGRALLYLNANNNLASNLGASQTTGTTTFSENVWHHAAMTFDGTTVQLYLDGQLDATRDITAEAADGILQLGSNKGTTALFAGLMDETTVYNRILSDREIAALAQADVMGVENVDVALEVVDFETISTTTDIDARLQNLTWNPGTLASTNVPLSSWSYPLPPEMENFYEIFLRSSDANDNQGTPRMAWRGTIDTVAPRVTFDSFLLGEGETAETQYTFTFDDFILDDATFVHPCAAGDLVTQTYPDDGSPLSGQIFQVSATCLVNGHQTASITVTACDVVGLCTEVSAVPQDAPEPTPTPEPDANPLIGETGTITLTGTIDQGISVTIPFQGSYSNPVVVAMVTTFNHPEPVDVRVMNVSSTDFDLFMEEAGGDLLHGSETVSYLVMEAGSYTLDSGLVVEAGTLGTATVHAAGPPVGDAVTFSVPFANTPALLYTLNSYNNADFMSTTANSVTTTGFNIAQEAAETGMTAVTETIGWIAFSTGTGLTSGFNYVIGQGKYIGGDGVSDNTPHTVSYTFGQTPIIVAKSNSVVGYDGHWARGAGTYDATTFTIYAEEDKVSNSEQNHANETFAWAAFDHGTLFYSDGGSSSGFSAPEGSGSASRLRGSAVGGELPTGILIAFMAVMLILLAGAAVYTRRKNK